MSVDHYSLPRQPHRVSKVGWAHVITSLLRNDYAIIKFNYNYTIYVFFSFEEMDIEKVKSCIFDHFTIYDGNSKDHRILLGPTCGSLPGNLTKLDFIAKDN